MPAPRQVSLRQLELLLEYMEGHKDFAVGCLPGLERSETRARYVIWQHLAHTLNNQRIGIKKSAKEWNKYWIEQKYKAKRKLAYLKRHADNSELIAKKPLTDIEKRVLTILDEEFDRAFLESLSKAIKAEAASRYRDDEGKPQDDSDMHQVFLPSSDEKSDTQEHQRVKKKVRDKRQKDRSIKPDRASIFHERRLAIESQVAHALTQLAASVASLNDNLAGIRAALEAN